MTFMDTEDGAWGSYNPTVEAARREAFDLRCEVRALKKERDGLKAEVKRLKEVALIFIDEIQVKDIELLKARELLKQAKASCHPKMSDAIDEFLQ